MLKMITFHSQIWEQDLHQMLNKSRSLQRLNGDLKSHLPKQVLRLVTSISGRHWYDNILCSCRVHLNRRWSLQPPSSEAQPMSGIWATRKERGTVLQEIALVKKPPVLPRGKTVWGVVKQVQVVKTREGVVKMKLEVVFWSTTMTNLLCPLTGHASCFTHMRQFRPLDVTCTRPLPLASQGRRSIRQQQPSGLVTKVFQLWPLRTKRGEVQGRPSRQEGRNKEIRDAGNPHITPPGGEFRATV